MNLNFGSLTIGLLAGVAAAFLCIAAGEPTMISILLFAAATLPILIASLGWTNTAGFLAAAVAGLIVTGFVSPMAGLVFTITTLAPAAWIGHLANLARPAEELGGPAGAYAWYPIADILFQLCLLVSLGLIVIGMMMGYGEDMIGEVADQFLAMMAAQDPDLSFSDEDRQAYARFFLAALPVVQGAIWVLILFTALYVAMGIVRMSGRARRPKDDLPESLRMPRMGLYLFGIALAATIFGGTIGLVGAVLAGALSAGFVLAGFAIVHHRTRGRSWRSFALWGAYFAVVLFTLPLLFFLVSGMIETARAVPLSKGGPGGGNGGNDNN